MLVKGKNKNLTTELFVLCDNAIVSRDGKMSLIGIFERIGAQNFPVIHPKMSLAAVIKGEKSARLAITLQVLNPKGEEVVSGQSKNINISLMLGPLGKGNLIIDLITFRFDIEGDYTFVLKHNGQIFAKTAVNLYKVIQNQSNYGFN